MSMKDYEKASSLIKQYLDNAYFIGSRSEALVGAAEQALNLKFPVTYRRFVLEYGAGGLGGEEIYGVINENFEHSGGADAVWNTLELRRRVEFSNDYIAIYSVGDGEVFCLDLGTSMNNEPPVIAFEPGLELRYQTREVITQDFGAFLLQRIEEGIKFLKSED